MMTTDTSTKTDQKATIEKLLDDEQVLVHLNPSSDGVTLPDYLMDNRTVTLRLSRFFKGSLSTTESGIEAELLFGPDYFLCNIPWDCVWGASSVRGEEFVWAEAAPPEILHMVLTQDSDELAPAKHSLRSRKSTPKERPSYLRRVK